MDLGDDGHAPEIGIMCDTSDDHYVTIYGNTPANRRLAAYIARCGSQPVRDILAACDDDELARWATFVGKWRLPAFDIENVESLAWATVTFKPR